MTTFPRTRRLLLVLLALATLTAACGGGEKTGDESLLNFDQEQAEKFGGSTTTTTAVADPAATTAPPTTAPKAQPGQTTTTAPRVTTTLPPEKQEVTIEVAINEQSPYFAPSVVQVLVGSKVRFTNTGTKPHSVLSDTGAFDSGQIPPGGVWIYDAERPGRYNYSDAGRPFAVGSIEVS